MKQTNSTVTIIGAGFVGLSTAALLSNAGYQVYLIEINPERLKAIQSGRSFFFEEGIDPLIKRAVDENSLIATNSYEEAITKSDIIFSCVGTPDNADGSSNLDYVFSAAETAAKLMKPGTIYVQKSTVPVGTGQNVSEVISCHQKDFSYVSNPEFLRESTALFDTLYFDRVVVGGDNHSANQTIISIYQSIAKQRDALAKLAGIKPGNMDGQYIELSLNGAELVKVTANAFLALKISFANNIAMLADKAGADVQAIMDAVGADRRIGRSFLNASRGYGGGCFPKDVTGLIKSAEEYGVDMPIMKAATTINGEMPGYIISKFEDAAGHANGKKIAILGLAFKAGTSDARRSPGVTIANLLHHDGAQVCAFDPQANEEALPDLRKGINLCESIQAAVKDNDVVFIATDWPEFRDVPKLLASTKQTKSILVDCMNMFDPKVVKELGIRYIGVGR